MAANDGDMFRATYDLGNKAGQVMTENTDNTATGVNEFQNRVQILNTDPTLRFYETDQADPAGRYQWRVVGGEFKLQRSTGAGWSGVSDIVTVDASDNVTFEGDVSAVGGAFSGQVDFGTFSATGASDGKEVNTAGFFVRSSRTAVATRTHYQFIDASGGVAGSITTDGSGNTSYATTSDERVKSDHRAFDPGPIIDAVEVTDHLMFGQRKRGFRSAQNLHSVFPEAVVEGERWGVDASRLVPVLLLELKQLRARVAALEGR